MSKNSPTVLLGAPTASSISEQSVLRVKRVVAITGLSRSSIYDMQKRGLFPKSIQLSVRAVAWREREVAAWLASRPQ
jgi:prophage regulatory protein